MGFQQGLSGLNISSKSLEVIGNNVANANTYGFKSARAEFADMYAASLGGAGNNGIGIGARIANVAQQFTQGNVSTTANNLDLAINGDGFFQVQRWDEVAGSGALAPAGEVLYTRNGQFKVDSSGYITNNQDRKVLGVGNQPIQLNLNGGSAEPTQMITAQVNLNASEETDAAFSTTANDWYSFTTTQTLYDVSGEPIPLQYYFRKSGTDSWEVFAYVGDTALPAEGQPAVSIEFDPATSLPLSMTDADGNAVADFRNVPFPTIPGGTSSATQSELTFNIDFSDLTQFAGKSNVNALMQDGFPKGEFSSFNVDATGAILVRYTNGQTVTEGQLVLARFANAQGLQPMGGNEWAVTAASGTAQIDAPGSGRFGFIQGGALEESNVDLTGELVNMIVAQRSYQANAQTIKTEDQVLQTLVNLR